MILIFLLAGAVSIGASALMARVGNHGEAVADDFAVQSAVAVTASKLTASGGCPTNSLCLAETKVPLAPLASLPFSQPTNVCAVASLSRFESSLPSTLWIFFNARWQGLPGQTMFAYVDMSADPMPTCRTSPGTGTQCSAPPQTPRYAQPSALPPCSLSAPPQGMHWWLFVHNDNNGNQPAPQPKQAFVLQSATPSAGQSVGTLYVTASSTGPRISPDYEEAFFYLPPVGVQLQLLYEAPLP